jgi:DNA-binding MltR family transcriptional regulator
VASDSSSGNPEEPGKSVTYPAAAKALEIAQSLSANVQKLANDISGLKLYMDAHVVIVGSAIMDKNLERALLTKMQPLSRDFRDRIFDGYGPLSNFSAKIDMAFALGIIPRQMLDDLKSVNRVRVRFAHTTKTMNFQNSEVAALMDAISGMDVAIPDLKVRFLNRLKEIDVHLDSVYAAHCKATGQTPTDVDASLLS